MRIGVDISPLTLKKTGVGNYIFYHLLELIQLCPEHTFFLYTFRKEESPFGDFPHVNVRVIPRFSISEAFWSQTTLAYHLFRDKIDLFWGTTQSIPLFRRPRLKTVLTLYDFSYLLTPKTVSFVRCLYLRLLTGYFLRKADRLTTISQGTADRMLLHYNKKAHSVIQPPKIGIQRWTEEELVPWLENRGLKYKEYLLILGTKEPRKNLVPTLKTYLSLLEQKESLYPLVIIGKKGWRDKEIVEVLSHIKAYKQVHLLDYLEDEETSKYFSAARLYLFPSTYEGYGMPVKEARICGTPVLCLNVPEVIEAAENDAIILKQEGFEKGLIPYFRKEGLVEITSPHPVTYPSNRELASKLAALIKEFV